MKNVNITGVHQFLGEESHIYIYIYGELPKKGGLQKNREDVFDGGWYLDAHYDLIQVQAGT